MGDIIVVILIGGGGAGGRCRGRSVVTIPNISRRRDGIMIHGEKSFALMEVGRLYTRARRFAGWIRTQDVHGEVGSRPLPGGVVVSEEEKGRTLALSLTHRVGRIDRAGDEKCTDEGSSEDPTNEQGG